MAPDSVLGQLQFEDVDEHTIGLPLGLGELVDQLFIGVLLSKHLDMFLVDFVGVSLALKDGSHRHVTLPEELL